jgi:hypothetical protein
MTDSTPTDPTGEPATAPDAAPVPAPTVAPAPAPAPAAQPDLGDRMKAFGQEASTRGQELGREAQAAGDRWSRDPSVVRVASTASRIWGLIVLVIGLWFFAQYTLGYALPAIPWREAWPVALVALGLLVIARGMTRRT